MFEQIKNDPYITECYLTADDPSNPEGFWVYHGLNHINNVIEMVEKILIQLDYNEEYIENAKIGALLHDIGYGGIKKDHEIRSYQMAKDYFEKNNLKLKYETDVLEAIKSHRSSFDSDNIMAITLILADKLDIKNSRLTEEGKKIPGLKEYQYIEDINFYKKDNDLTVQFVIGDGADKEELENWYFTEKVFKAIHSFANYFNFNLKILWNNEEWKLKQNKAIKEQ